MPPRGGILRYICDFDNGTPGPASCIDPLPYLSWAAGFGKAESILSIEVVHHFKLNEKFDEVVVLWPDIDPDKT